ncbi:MAG: recombinase family protein [Polyangiales bacterium]
MSANSPDANSHAAVYSSKVASRHHERIAIVYVRQSTNYQLLHHQESTRMQYDLVDRAVALGWRRDRVLVIDADLGRSGASTEGRPGFKHMVAEVGLGHVGILLGVDVSRIARNCRDWYQLLEMCSLFGTLISDLDGVYDPSHYNDRLLLGLKGTMSEAELHTIKMRMLEGRLHKAERGELAMQLPTGYVRRPSGEVALEPDEQARAVVALVFDVFDRCGSLSGVLRHLVSNGIQLPVRVQHGPERGDLQWRRPVRMTLYGILTHPIYAGVYVWGRRTRDPRRRDPARAGSGRVFTRAARGMVYLPSRAPAYITEERYEMNRARLSGNRQIQRGAPRSGDALVAGLLRCGRCGHRMGTNYNEHPRYACTHESRTYAGPICQSLAAACVDEAVEALLLRALEPASLEVSLAVAADIDAERTRTETMWLQRLERAQQDVDRSRRQYNAVEPENRLVARTLERQLEEHLRAKLELQENYRRYQAERPGTLTADEREMIRGLASDVPALWRASTTTIAQRKSIVHQLVQEVAVTVDGESERVDLAIRWVGGHRTQTRLARPVAKLSQLSYYADLLARARALRLEGGSYGDIASALNAEGWRPARQRGDFSDSMVSTLLAERDGTRPRRARGDAAHARDARRGDDGHHGGDALSDAELREHEWTPDALAKQLDVHVSTLHRWVHKGQMKGRKIPSANLMGRWLLWADPDELGRLRALRATANASPSHASK